MYGCWMMLVWLSVNDFFFLAAKSPLPSIIKMSSSSLVNLTVNVYFEAIVIRVKVCFEAIVALSTE